MLGSSPLLFNMGWLTGNTNKVDAISISGTIRKVMSQMGPGLRDAFTVS